MINKPPSLQPVKSDTSLYNKFAEASKPHRFLSRNTRSKVIMKKTALNLLMDKSKFSENMQLTPMENTFGGMFFNTVSMEEKSRLTFGNATQQQNEKGRMLSPQSTMEYYMKTGSINQDFAPGFHNQTVISCKPTANQNSYNVLPKIHTKRENRNKLMVYFQK